MADGNGLGDTGAYVAPGGKTKINDYSSGAGLTGINNRGTFGPIVVPGDDGEPWGIDEVLTAAVVGLPQAGANLGEKFGIT